MIVVHRDVRIHCSRCGYSRILRKDEAVPKVCPACNNGEASVYSFKAEAKASR